MGTYITRRVTFTATMTISDYGLTAEKAAMLIESALSDGLNICGLDDISTEFEYFESVYNKEISREEEDKDSEI